MNDWFREQLLCAWMTYMGAELPARGVDKLLQLRPLVREADGPQATHCGRVLKRVVQWPPARSFA
jgi:hypothetical protein